MEYALFFVGGVIVYYINDKVKNKFNNDDYFDGKGYVKKIKEAVKNKDIKSIGVYGKWGIGKTSIIKKKENTKKIKLLSTMLGSIMNMIL